MTHSTRDGWAEEHVPLFYPETPAEYDEIYRVMLTKLGPKHGVKRSSGRPSWTYWALLPLL